MADYAKDVLVETDWVAEHLTDDGIRIVEVDLVNVPIEKDV
jgi:thiosulfate/3-mercaptopyruvate sulfurtransferase